MDSSIPLPVNRRPAREAKGWLSSPRSRQVLRTTGMGDEERLPPPRLGLRCRLGEETLAGTRSNDEDALIPDARRSGVPLRSLTDSGPSSGRAHRRRCANYS